MGCRPTSACHPGLPGRDHNAPGQAGRLQECSCSKVGAAQGGPFHTGHFFPASQGIKIAERGLSRRAESPPPPSGAPALLPRPRSAVSSGAARPGRGGRSSPALLQRADLGRGRVTRCTRCLTLPTHHQPTRNRQQLHEAGTATTPSPARKQGPGD